MINEQVIIKKGMDCLHKNLGIIEIEMFISAIMKSAYDYTGWRREYFGNAYKDGDKSQLENFLNSAADNDPKSVSFGLSDESSEA
ncbi:MAG: hypothetical protein FWH10_02500 [Oscillospiraceae bacterium]|nr:hypothetical protein [Oscillospiraceae bacterium]